MPQLFHPASNAVARLSVAGAVVGVVVLWWAAYQLVTSPYRTEQNVAREQPVPFSHLHHVTGLGLDCRYCHNSVEDSPFAGIPPTKTCYGCHRVIWKDAEILAPVRESYRTGTPLHWTRVNDLPDFVYFDHSIHVRRGVGCETCHGRVDLMPLTWKAEPLFMQWCLECHRNPRPRLRPPDQVFAMGWKPSPEHPRPDQPVRAPTNCSTCHR